MNFEGCNLAHEKFISMINKDEQLMVDDKEWKGTEEWKQA